MAAARSIASLSLGFGLVSIPVKLYSATESSATVSFRMLAKDGSRVRQQYISENDQQVVARADMIKGYEFEKDRFVLFTPEELKALEEGASHSIDIVAFIPATAIDPIYYDKAYFLAPDKRGGKPYNLLMEAMKKSERCALAKWSWKSKQYVVQVRPAEDGLVLQQLLYADEVRSLADLDIEHVQVSEAELKLAMQLIEQIAADTYDPTMFEDEEKKRILAAIDEKIAGKEIVAAEHAEQPAGAQVIDLVEALRASLGKQPAGKAKTPGPVVAKPAPQAVAKPAPARAAATPRAAAEAPAPAVVAAGKDRKGARRAVAAPAAEEVEAPPARARARK